MKRSRDSGEEADSPLDDVQEVSLRPVSKVIGLDVESLSDEALTATVIQCSMPGHLPGLSFATYNEYETHYNSTHTNRCLECWRNFPTSHYLDLHLAECHNVLVEIRKDKGEAVVRILPAWNVYPPSYVDKAPSLLAWSKPAQKNSRLRSSGRPTWSKATCFLATISSP